MTAASNPEFNEAFTLELVQYQQCLEGQMLDTPAGATLCDLSPEQRTRVERAKRCLSLLHEVASRASSAHSTPLDTNGKGERSRPSLPTSIGRFKIVQRLGLGGFGIVYKAYDARAHRDVAIKVPRLEVLASETMLERFELEAAAAGQLEHPNIVAMLEAGSDGVMPFLVMPFYAGPTLSEWLGDRSKLPKAEWSAEIVRQLALAVDYAHGRGILHRDIKPSNILLTGLNPSDDGATLVCIPKLMDFGLAKLADLAGDLTKSGTILGTVKYMAPEQATGRKGQVTTASDIYSLGVVLYQLLSGNVPFDGPTEVDTLRQIASEDPPPIPRGRSSKERDIAAICMKCLEKEPKRRYATAADLAEDLRRALAGEIVSAKAANPLERTIKWTRTHPLWVALAVLIVAATSAIIAGSLWYNQRLSQLLEVAKQDRLRAHAGELKARKQAYIADMRDLLEKFVTSKRDEVQAVLDRYVPKAGEPDVRGFEWRLVDKYLRTDSSCKELFTHEGGVSATAIHPDATIAASAGSDSIIRLWKLPGGESAGALLGHGKGAIDALAFSPDGMTLASASEDTTIRLWNMTALQQQTVLKGHTDWVSSVAFAPDGKTLASGSGDRRIILWDVADGRVIREITGHTDTVRSVVFDPTRPILYSSGEDETVRAWDTETGQPSGRIENGQIPVTNNRWVRQLFLGRNGEELLGADGSEEIQRWSTDESSFGHHHHLRDIPGHLRLACLAELPSRAGNGHVIVRGSEEGTISISGCNHQGAEPTYLIGHSSQVDALAASQDARFFISGDSAGKLLLWDFEVHGPKTIRQIRPATPIGDVQIASDGESYFCIDRDSIRLLEFGGNSRPIQEWSHDFGDRSDILVSPRGDIFVQYFKDRYVIRHVGQEGELVRNGLSGKIEAIEFAPDGSWLAIAVDDGWSIVDVRQKTLMQQYQVVSPIRAMQAIDHKSVFAACEDGCVRRLAIDDGDVKQTMTLDRQPLASIRLSPDRKTLAVGGVNFALILDAETGKELARLSHRTLVSTILFLDQGRRLLTNDAEPNTRLWDLETFQFVGTLDPFDFEGLITCAADGLRLCCEPTSGHILLLDARLE